MRTSGRRPSRRAIDGATPVPTEIPGYWSSTISRDGAWKRPTAVAPRKAPIRSGVIAMLALYAASMMKRAAA